MTTSQEERTIDRVVAEAPPLKTPQPYQEARHSSLATSAVNGVWIGVGSCKRAL
jgi:hypothetical protein